ncbi:MAG: Rieske 2Fe-2S domain-containing protein [Ilumatobacteraceae bacterium]
MVASRRRCGHERWLDVGDVVEVTKRRKFVVTDGEATIVIVAHDGAVFALDNICIHRQRELVKGVVLRTGSSAPVISGRSSSEPAGKRSGDRRPTPCV